MLTYGKCSKISNTKKEKTPWIYFLSSPLKQREVTNFAKGGNLIASLCKIGYFPHIIFGIFLFEIKILLYKFLEILPYTNQCGCLYQCQLPEHAHSSTNVALSSLASVTLVKWLLWLSCEDLSLDVSTIVPPGSVCLSTTLRQDVTSSEGSRSWTSPPGSWTVVTNIHFWPVKVTNLRNAPERLYNMVITGFWL